MPPAARPCHSCTKGPALPAAAKGGEPTAASTGGGAGQAPGCLLVRHFGSSGDAGAPLAPAALAQGGGARRPGGSASGRGPPPGGLPARALYELQGAVTPASRLRTGIALRSKHGPPAIAAARWLPSSSRSSTASSSWHAVTAGGSPALDLLKLMTSAAAAPLAAAIAQTQGGRSVPAAPRVAR